MRRTAIFVATLATALTTLARAGMVDDCVLERDPNLRIGGCTAVIGSDEWKDKGLAWAYIGRGIAYSRLNEHVRAIQDYDQALRIDPGYAKACNGRAWSLYLMGRHAEALGDVDRALSLDHGDVRAIDTRAHVLTALGRQIEAQREFERAMQAGGADLVRTYQEALAKHGSYQGAIDGFYGPVTRAALAACLGAGCRLLE